MNQHKIVYATKRNLLIFTFLSVVVACGSSDDGYQGPIGTHCNKPTKTKKEKTVALNSLPSGIYDFVLSKSYFESDMNNYSSSFEFKSGASELSNTCFKEIYEEAFSTNVEGTSDLTLPYTFTKSGNLVTKVRMARSGFSSEDSSDSSNDYPFRPIPDYRYHTETLYPTFSSPNDSQVWNASYNLSKFLDKINADKIKWVKMGKSKYAAYITQYEYFDDKHVVKVVFKRRTDFKEPVQSFLNKNYIVEGDDSKEFVEKVSELISRYKQAKPKFATLKKLTEALNTSSTLKGRIDVAFILTMMEHRPELEKFKSQLDNIYDKKGEDLDSAIFHLIQEFEQSLQTD